MTKRICMLLNNTIANDSRVIKTINTLSKKAEVDLFYLDGSPEDSKLFNGNVNLKSLSETNSFFKKLIRHSFFTREFMSFVSLVKSSNSQYDIIWSNDLPTLFPAKKLAKHYQAKLVYDSHEIYIETLNQFFPKSATFPKKTIFKILLKLMRFHGKIVEQKILKNVDYFITVNESILEYFQSKYVIKNGAFIMNLPYLVDSSKIEAIDFRTQFNLESNDTICIYQGVLNEGRGLKTMIDALKLCPAHIKLIIVGSGVLEKELKQKAHDLIGLQIFFIPQVSLEILPAYTKGADLGINLLEEFNLSKKMASPNKLFEYIHAGIPVLCSKGLENEKVLNSYEIGISANLNAVDISKEIRHLASQKQLEKYKESLNSARLFYNWQNQEEKLIATLA